MRKFSSISLLSLVSLLAVVISVVTLPSSAAWGGADEVRLARSPFGLFYVGRRYVDRARDLNAAYVRGIVDWGTLEPKKGVFRFKKLDVAVKAAGRNNLQVVLLVRALSTWGGRGSKPGWDKKGRHTVRKASVPRDMEGWKDFLRALVDRYDGDGRNDMPGLEVPIKFWQIENEWLLQWSGTAEEYMDFLKASYDVIKAEDPSASVISGALTMTENAAMAEGFIKGSMEAGGPRNRKTLTREKILKAGLYQRRLKPKFDTFFDKGADSFDILDFHSYTKSPYIITGQVAWIKSMMEKRGYTKPLWSLEHAGPFFDYTVEAHSAQVVQRYMLALESGVEVVFWSSLVPAGNQNFFRLALQGRKGVKRPAYFTYKLMTGKLKDATSFRRIETGDEYVFLYRFTVPRGALYVGWARGGSKSVTIPWEGGSAQLTHVVVSGERAETERIGADKGILKVTLTELPVFID
jgi:hypothetical protein